MKLLRFGMLCTAVLGINAAHAASIDWNGWKFDYSTSDNSSGLVLTDVYYNDKQILAKASMPVMRVQYDNDVCGPYADILSSGVLRAATQGAPEAACNNKALCERTFTLNGENILEIGSNWQIGEYQIYQTYYFSDQGYVDARVYSRGLQCQINHSHHAHWMLDFDIEGSENDRIVLPDGSIPNREFNDLKSNSAFWTIEDSASGNSVTLTPSDDDGLANSFAQSDFAARAYRSSEVGRWQLGARGDIGEYYMNNENINSADNVVWYVSHLPHAASEGSSLWHASGPRIDANFQGQPEPTPEPVTPNPEPAEGNLLANGDFTQGKSGWFDCGPTANANGDSGAMRISNGGCLYQEVSASVGQQYELSCDISREGNRWTVMELSFLDANFTSLASSVSQVRSGAATSQYSEVGAAPENTVYGLAVLYSEDNTSFDNCVLRPLDATTPEPNPTPQPAANLLNNGGFENDLANWSSCAATSLVDVSSDASDGSKSIVVNNGGCLYQEFSVESGRSYKLECKAKRTGGQYTSMTLAMLDNQYASLANQEEPINTSVYNNYTATVVAPAASEIGTVVVYSEDPGHFDQCEVLAI